MAFGTYGDLPGDPSNQQNDWAHAANVEQAKQKMRAEEFSDTMPESARKVQPNEFVKTINITKSSGNWTMAGIVAAINAGGVAQTNKFRVEL